MSTTTKDPNRGVAVGQVREVSEGTRVRVIQTRYIPDDGPENANGSFHTDVLFEVLESATPDLEQVKHYRRRAGTVSNYKRVA